jgi:haloacetate dehalogenase
MREFEDFTQLDIDTGDARIHLRHGGEGPPLLLLHGYPQTHYMWHLTAVPLSQQFHVVCPDLRGYGDSSKPPSSPDFSTYSKRTMAGDMVTVMDTLGFPAFGVAGHDRGARVAHRMALDHPNCVEGLCVMDIAPTLHMFRNTDQTLATAYYHWFFLIQPNALPEQMIGADPEFFLRDKMSRWSGNRAHFDEAAVAEYLRCYRDPETIRASCDDYRAAASIDLRHDEEDQGRKLDCPVLALWGDQGFIHQNYDVLSVWGEQANNLQGTALPCGHFLAEEAPELVVAHLTEFFGTAG